MDAATPASTRSPRILSGDDRASIDTAVAALRRGEPVAFPTETVYGLGAPALDPVAVARIFEIKQRPAFDPIIVHVAAATSLAELAVDEDLADPRVAALQAHFWPGPLTLVLRKRDVVPGIVTAGLDTVAVRMPDHPVALALIEALGQPVAAPSANRFGSISPTRAEHVVSQLADRIGIVLEGGASRVGVESTVLFLSAGRAALLRPGGLPLEAIESVIGHVEIPPEHEARSLSPGRTAAHYAPHAHVVLTAPDEPVDAVEGERIGLLAADDSGRATAEGLGGPFAVVETLSPDGDPVVAAANLFDALHRLDAAGVDRIVAQPMSDVGLGRAVMDRLRRAAAAGRVDAGPAHPRAATPPDPDR